jgi:hypothetical protein
MPLVHVTDLLDHARDSGYRAAAFGLASLDAIFPVIEAAERSASPVVLVFDADNGRRLAPALAAAVSAARSASVPVVIEARSAPDAETVVRAIRAGANSVMIFPAAGVAQERIDALTALARDCGIPLFISNDPVAPDRCRHYCRLPVDHMNVGAVAERILAESGGNGHGVQALSVCRPWREVEHLIVYNASDDNEVGLVDRMMDEGCAVLGAIPGVRRVFTGRALRNDARYRYCWLVRFASPAVIASYRDHPDHVAFADGQFRPLAADRLSIDFESLD